MRLKFQVILITILLHISVAIKAQHTAFNNSSLLKNYTIPTQGEVISKYGWRNGRQHTGTDIRLKKNDPVYAAFDGVVKKAGTSRGYGFLIILEHDNNIETYYAHLNKILVKPGQKIKSGQLIGKGGKTGRATTTHLHFEIRINQKPINPESIFNFEQGTINYKTNNTKNKEKQNRNTKNIYVVKKGDTLYSIAKRFNKSVNIIRRINNIKKTAIIHPGDRLKIK
ncbi:MAG: peptidoglycan DD-metalloendopeptidase family protein [Marinilabiliaceae bacterium]|nr:peptidoglycan DD-metalloendopeptidase family protein [Marinilabiliaceae bacterium]